MDHVDQRRTMKDLSTRMYGGKPLSEIGALISGNAVFIPVFYYNVHNRKFMRYVGWEYMNFKILPLFKQGNPTDKIREL